MGILGCYIIGIREYRPIRPSYSFVNSLACDKYESTDDTAFCYSKGQDHGKPYASPTDKGKKKVIGGNWIKKSGGDVRCFECGGSGHHFGECKNPTLARFKYGKMGHRAYKCMSKDVVCYNCGESGHFSTICQKPKKVRSYGKWCLHAWRWNWNGISMDEVEIRDYLTIEA